MQNAQNSLFGSDVEESLLKAGVLPVLHDTWRKPETAVFMRHMKLGELTDALDVLGKLKVADARAVLLEAGFEPALKGGRQNMMESVQKKMIYAIQSVHAGMSHEVAHESGGNSNKPSFADSLKMIQAVMSAPIVEVGIGGDVSIDSRISLQFVAGQSLEKGVPGFAIEGVMGKFQLPRQVVLEELKSLYSVAGGVVAEMEVRSAFPGWANGKMASKTNDLVPESVARILRGSASIDAAIAVQKALDSGAVKEFGAQQGLLQAGNVLKEQGVLINAPLVNQILERENLKVTEPDRQRGQYIGPVVAVDHRDWAVKWARESALVMRYKDLPDGVEKPARGDLVKLKFSNSRVDVVVQSRVGDRGGR